MSKKNKNPTAQVILFFVISAVSAMVIWPLLDLFWASVIDHTQFVYSPQDHIWAPLIFAVIFTAIIFLTQSINKSKKK